MSPSRRVSWSQRTSPISKHTNKERKNQEMLQPKWSWHLGTDLSWVEKEQNEPPSPEGGMCRSVGMGTPANERLSFPKGCAGPSIPVPPSPARRSSSPSLSQPSPSPLASSHQGFSPHQLAPVIFSGKSTSFVTLIASNGFFPAQLDRRLLKAKDHDF